MNAFDLEVLPEAEAREAFHWYLERSPLVADAFRAELLDAIGGLATTAKPGQETKTVFATTT